MSADRTTSGSRIKATEEDEGRKWTEGALRFGDDNLVVLPCRHGCRGRRSRAVQSRQFHRVPGLKCAGETPRGQDDRAADHNGRGLGDGNHEGYALPKFGFLSATRGEEPRHAERAHKKERRGLYAVMALRQDERFPGGGDF